MTVIFSDDFAYATATAAPGTVWDQNLWTSTLTSATQQAFNSFGRLVGTSTASWAGQTSKNAATSGDFEVFFHWRKSTTTFIGSVQMQASGTLAYNSTYGYTYNNGYTFYSDSSTLRLAKIVNGSGTTLITSVATYASQTWYNVRWRKVGTTHSIKVWALNTTEPSTWVTGTESATTFAAGRFHVGLRGTFSFDIDTVTVDDLQSASGTSVNVMETPATVSALMADPTVGINVGYADTPGTATATLVEPAVAIGYSAATDFGSYALGASADWTNGTRTGTADWQIQNSAVALSGKALVNVSGISGTTTAVYAPAPNTTKGDALVRLRGTAGIALGWTSVTNHRYAYLQTVSSTTTLYYARPDTASGALLGSSVILDSVGVAGLNPNGLNWMRLNYANGVVRIRVWANGASEPGTWQLTVNDTPSFGKWGVAGQNGYSVDYFALNTSGGNATNYSKGKEINAVALTATATLVEPTVKVGTSRTINASALTASVEMTNAVVSTTANAVVYAGAAGTATADMLEATNRSPHVVNYPAPATAIAELLGGANGQGGHDETVTVGLVGQANAHMPTAAFSNMTDINIKPQPMTAAARLAYYTYEDDRFIKVIEQDFTPLTAANDTTSDNLWLRFGQSVPGPLRNYAQVGAPQKGSWNGTPDFNIRDDFGRPATHFSGDSYAVVNYNDYEDKYGPMTWEVVFRTTAANTVLLEAHNFYNNNEDFSRVSLTDGRLSVQAGYVNASAPTVFRAVGTVNDGQWHHAFITIGARGLEIFIDGVSRLIRTVSSLNSQFAGSAPVQARPIELVGGDHNGNTFDGDVLMFAQYDRELARDRAQEHYYAYTLATLIRVTPMGAIAGAGDNKGRGNKLRALALYRIGGPTLAQEDQLGPDYDLEPNWTGIRIWNQDASGNLVPDNTPFEFGPYTVYPRAYPAFTRDEYDLQPHVALMDSITDLSDYDMVFFLDLPIAPHSSFFDPALGRTFDLGAEYEKWVESVRRAIDNTGVSLWCPQPQLAVDLGFIDQLEVHGLNRESRDDKSYNEDNDVFKRRYNTTPEWYVDTHYLNQYRVAAQVEGFTDLEGFVVQDYVHWINVEQPFSSRPEYQKWNLLDLTGRGLRTGDVVYMPTDLFLNTGSNIVPKHLRWKVYSVPEGAYRGIAVAKEQTTLNIRGAEVPNPYSSNALTIVIAPGTSVKGRPIKAKALVDFMSGYHINTNQFLPENRAVVEQIGPFGEDTYDGYDYDTRRLTGFFSWLTTNIEYMRQGTTRTGVTEVPLYTEADKYPVRARRQYPWLERALNWLGIRERLEPGQVKVFAEAATAQVTSPMPVVRPQKHAEVTADAAQARALLVKPVGVDEPNATVYAFAATATAALVSPARIVQAEVSTATAVMPEPRVAGSGYDFVLNLRTAPTMTLYLKEDA